MIRPLDIEVPEGVSLKDPALLRLDDTYHLFCSWFYEENFSRVVAFSSKDLLEWEGPHWSWGEGNQGFCSPDVLQVEGQWIMTLQSWDAIPPRQSRNQLFVSFSEDLQHWSDPAPLAENLTQGVRAIDAALAHHQGRWFLTYKEAQSPKMAVADAISGPWEALPPPVDQWIENAQFLRHEDSWYLYATLLHHDQGIARMKQDGSERAHWSDWHPFAKIESEELPGFNRGIRSNAGSLWDDRQFSGNWIRVFCSADVPPRSNLDYSLGIETQFSFPN